MNALLLALFYTSGILLHGNGLPYGDWFSKYETLDDYYEDYYLKKIPKPKTSADKVKEFIINHLSWFPVDDLENERDLDWRHQNRRSDDIWNEIFIEPCEVAKTTTCKPYNNHHGNNATEIKKKVAIKVKNLTVDHHFPKNWTAVKNQSLSVVKDYVEKKHLKEVMVNVTHPLRYRGHLINGTKHKDDEHDEHDENEERKEHKEHKEHKVHKEHTGRNCHSGHKEHKEHKEQKERNGQKQCNNGNEQKSSNNGNNGRVDQKSCTCSNGRGEQKPNNDQNPCNNGQTDQKTINLDRLEPFPNDGPEHMNHNNHKEPQETCCECKWPPTNGVKNNGKKVYHPKSSHVEVIKKSTTPFPEPLFDSHFSLPRSIKYFVELKDEKKSKKTKRKADEKEQGTTEGDNSTHALGSDLAGKVTSLWHSVVGPHHEKIVPDIKDIRFYLYTRRNIIRPELLKVNFDLIKKRIKRSPKRIDLPCAEIPPDQIGDFERIPDEHRDIIKSNYLNLKAPTKILIHGYTGNYKDSRMAKIKDAYLDNGRYNVIQVDWEALAAPPCYIRVTHHSKFVGETIAEFLNGLYLVGLNMSLVHLVGFSLGAQVAGFTGNNATIAPVCRITGLDPALPLFLHTESSGHLDKFDAKFVDVIHTCGGILAMMDPLGHVDFYPNGGMRQPGCEFSNVKCSHSRAPQYFAESINSQKKFKGQLCLTWDEYVAGDCNNVTDISFMGEPCSRKSIPGKYYLMTKSKEPFVL